MEFLSTYCTAHPLIFMTAFLAFYGLSTALFIAGSAATEWFTSGHSNLKLIGSNALFSVLAMGGVVLCREDSLTLGVSFLIAAFCLMLLRLGVQAEMGTNDLNY